MVTLNKIVVGNSWKCTFWACEFQKIILGGGGRNSAIQPMRKVKPRWRPLTPNSSEGRKQFLYHFPS
jgi:hypothetical protein